MGKKGIDGPLQVFYLHIADDAGWRLVCFAQRSVSSGTRTTPLHTNCIGSPCAARAASTSTGTQKQAPLRHFIHARHDGPAMFRRCAAASPAAAAAPTYACICCNHNSLAVQLRMKAPNASSAAWEIAFAVSLYCTQYCVCRWFRLAPCTSTSCGSVTQLPRIKPRHYAEGTDM